MELFSQSANPYKEITESMCAYKNAKEYINIKNNSETFIMVGDGSLALTGSLFAFLTRGDAVSIDPKLNLEKVCLWREHEKVQRIHFCSTKFQEFAENFENYIPMDIKKYPYSLICVHAHVDLEELHACLPNWKYLFTNPCCNPQEQTFSIQFQKMNNISVKKAGYDTQNLSPKNMIFIYENNNITGGKND
jgi:hypothetical protein